MLSLIVIDLSIAGWLNLFKADSSGAILFIFSAISVTISKGIVKLLSVSDTLANAVLAVVCC